MINTVVIDGQGGRMGKMIVEQLKKCHPELELTAIGTNSIATATMLKAGADVGATGENPILVACRKADIIIGPVGIVIADALCGEITAKVACAVGRSDAQKFLIPVNRCNLHIAGTEDCSMSEYVRMAIEAVTETIIELSTRQT